MATRKPHQRLEPEKEAPRKKKKRVSRELAVVPETKRISKLNTKGMRSIIGDSVEEIQQMLEANNNESATSLMQKRLMQGVLDMLPYAEHSIRKTQGARGVYQFNSLITSLRELMIDMQSTRDKGAIGDALVEKIVRPAFLDIGMNLVLEDERMLKDIKEEVDITTYRKIREVHQESLGRTAKLIQEKYAEAKQQAITFLQQ